MTWFGVVRTYIGSYPRLTIVFVALNVIGAMIALWQYGPVAVVCGSVIYLILAMALKWMVLLWFHPKLFSFPRRITPVVVTALPFLVLAVALQLPLYRQMCTTDPAALTETHLCSEFAP